MEGTPTRARIDALESELLELCGHLTAATHRWLTLLAEFDDARGWAGPGTRSCAHWLNWKCGIDVGAAREKVRVAHALRALPALSAAMARGELSYSKARALTRVATPATEDVLLQIARHGTAEHVERLVRSYRRVREAENVARERRQQQARGVHWHVDEDGSYVFRLQLPAESGARFLAALDAAVEAMPSPGVSAETYTPGCSRPQAVVGKAPWSVRRADAAALIAESFLAHGAADLPGGERNTLVVHVAAEDYAAHRRESCEHHESASAPCAPEHGCALPLETARRLGCDASVIRLVVDAKGEPLDVGRRTRAIPPALRRALAVRDRGCRYPGCTNTRFVDGHHVRHWAEGGETSLGNLVLLCRFHHRLVHEGGVSVVRLDDGALRFIAPDGRALEPAGLEPQHAALEPQRTGLEPQHADRTLDPDGARAGHVSAETPTPWSHAPSGTTPRIVQLHRARGVDVHPRAAETRWCGERLDYGQAIDGLLWREARAAAPS